MKIALAVTASSALLLVAQAAPAMTLQGAPRAAGGAAVADPDERMERLAAASTPSSAGHGRPSRSRSILKADPNLQQAFAWLDGR